MKRQRCLPYLLLDNVSPSPTYRACYYANDDNSDFKELWYKELFWNISREGDQKVDEQLAEDFNDINREHILDLEENRNSQPMR